MKNLTPAALCELLCAEYGITRKPSTLAKLRCISSDGPPFIKVNRAVLYPEEPAREWARSLISPVRRSTSQTA